MLYGAIGEHLAAKVASAESRVLLVAPFIKKGAIDRVLAGLQPGVQLDVVTRWRVDELAAGVSDAEVYSVVKGFGGSLFLRNDLHAKYYRVDDHVLVGSANLTGAALGWANQCNLECLTPVRSDDSTRLFEAEVCGLASRVNEDLATQFLEVQERLRGEVPRNAVDLAGPDPGDPIDVLCRLPRDPNDIWLAYVDPASDLVGSQTRDEVLRFLGSCGVPPGITDRRSFIGAVGVALWIRPEVRSFHEWVGDSRRFGEIREFRSRRPVISRAEADFEAQVLIRNLVFFLPDRFRLERPRHAEVVRAT